MENLTTHSHTADIDLTLYWCAITASELATTPLAVPAIYTATPLRLVYGADIAYQQCTYKAIVFVEAEVEVEEWKNLSPAVKAYREKRGEKNDTTWIKCTPELKGAAATNFFATLTTVDEKFAALESHLTDLFDGIDEEFSYLE